MSAKTRTNSVSSKPKKWVSGATVRSPSRKKVAKPLGFCFSGFELTSVRQKAYNRTMKKCKESEFSYEN